MLERCGGTGYLTFGVSVTILWLDTETYSECDLRTAGTHRYAEHPSTEIIVAQWAIDDGEPVVEDLTGARHVPSDALYLALANADEVVAHNSAFDRTVIRHCWGMEIPVERWRDTMVQAMAHGLPGALDKVGAILGLEGDDAKDKRGRRLIQFFCKPQPRTGKRNDRTTHPAEWAEFLEYSRQDIVAMRAIHRALPQWNCRPGSPELALWHLDQRINDRGFAVDLALATGAIAAVTEEQARLKAAVVDATDGEVSGPSKRDDLLVHILMEYGVTLPDMRADTLRRRIEDPDLPDGVRLLLSLRLEATKTSTAKYTALVRGVSSDGRLRNTTQFCGAQRTGRDAHRLFQPGNMPRPDMDQGDIDLGIEALKSGCASMVFDDVMRLTSNCIRGTIVAPPGRKLVVADLANIEGRGLAYLAGEDWKVQAFREYDAGTGPDLYKLAYARAFNVEPAGVAKGQRQIGKVMELGLGYGGGVVAFLTFAAVYQMDLADLAREVQSTASPEALHNAAGMWEWAVKKRRTAGLPREIYIACEVLKAAWRAAHPATVALWSALQDAVVKAITDRSQAYRVRDLAVRCDGSWLRIRLPSGRYLCYVDPKVDEGGEITYAGINQYTRQWGRIKTYGGKLCLAGGTLVLARRGWTRIENITAEDNVWDGLAWVKTDGHVCNGIRPVMLAFGAYMTPDHLVLTTEGWRSASQSEGHHRAACRIPDGTEVPRQRWEEVDLVGGLRLRGHETDGSVGIEETARQGDSGVVRVYAPQDHCQPADDPRHEQTSGLRGVAQHAGQMHFKKPSRLAQLRGPWHKGVQAVATLLRHFLGRHGPDLRLGADTGQVEQRRGLHPTELSMGYLSGTGQQHPREFQAARDDRVATGPTPRHLSVDHVLPTGQGGAVRTLGGSPGRVAQVYDLVNCGPRNRFVIWAGDGPLIVHNCENVTQAWARDVLFYNTQAVEDEGYDILFKVHDELPTEAPDTPEYSSAGLAALMSVPPAWAPGCPLAAAGFETYRYRKD
jgi:DNA polymerase bacteriophage-type